MPLSDKNKAIRQSTIDSTQADYNSALSKYNDYVKQYAAQHPETGELSSASSAQALASVPEIQSAYQDILGKYQAADSTLRGLDVTSDGKGGLAQPPDYTRAPVSGNRGWAKVARSVAPALIGTLLAPGLGSALGAGLGLGTTAASALAGSALGGLGSAAFGQNPLLGALMGGAGGFASGGGLGDIMGSAQEGLGSLQSAFGIPDLGFSPSSVLSGAAPTGAASNGGAIGIPNGFLGGGPLSGGVSNAGTFGYDALGNMTNTGASLGALGSTAAAPTALSAGTSLLSGLSPDNLLSKAVDKISGNPLGALGALATVGSALTGNKVSGTQTQQQILEQMQAEKAKQQAFSDQAINRLNTTSVNRAPVNPGITDYYNYGSRPQATFFDQVNTPITY